ncbi:MAG: T9SS type A sorting domain-containing protein, partial [Candidatus Cloacimonetes bacterium]|nr:T9SS type A sorting domain-containing protein [Candidatus Cloacimonadota bacterium]
EISVYNIKGQLIKKLLDRPQNRGSHSLEFNTKELSTGVYFYKLHTDNYAKTRKLLVIE